MTAPSDTEPAEDSQHIVRPLTGRTELGSFPVTAILRQYVDTSSEETKQATTTALREITAWVGENDSLTVKHVIDGNQTASNAGVPLGPFDDDEGRQIVKTIFDDSEGRRSEKWDRTKTVITWLLSLAGLALTAYGIRLAYLRFFTGN